MLQDPGPVFWPLRLHRRLRRLPLDIESFYQPIGRSLLARKLAKLVVIA